MTAIAAPVARRPIDATVINLAVEKARRSWASWSPARRPQACADLQVALEAEVKHGREDFWHTAFGDRDGGDRHLSEAYLLPRERLASAALNALTHASIQTRLIREDIQRLRRQLAAGTDATQSDVYRADWSARASDTAADLATLIQRRRRAWQRALQLIADYNKETA